MVSHPIVRHRRLADAHGVGDLGHRALDEGVPRAPSARVAARSAPLARWVGCLVHRAPPGGSRRRQLRPLRCRRTPDPVRVAVAHRCGRVGRGRHVAPRRRGGHIAGHEADPAPVLALDPPVELRGVPAHESPCRLCRHRHHPLALPGHCGRHDRRRDGGDDLPTHPPSSATAALRPVGAPEW